MTTQTRSGRAGLASDTAYRRVFFVVILAAVGALAFAAGLIYSSILARADQVAPTSQPTPRVIYPKRTDLDFEGLKLQGEIRSPGEFYFQHRNEEKFDSLVKRRKNFHQEMLRDAVLSR